MAAPAPTRTPARRAARAVLLASAFLAAGAVVSVGVAVGIGLWGTVGDGQMGVARIQHGQITRIDEIANLEEGIDRSLCNSVLDLHSLTGPLVQLNNWGFGTKDVLVQVGGSQAMPVPNTYFVHQAGWPLRALEYRYVGVTTGLSGVFGSGWRAPSWLARSRYHLDGRPRPPLPLRPISLGLATNSIFYGGILVAPYALLLPLRRSLRRLRNLCPSCGYSREGLRMDQACPECGGQRG